MLSQLSPLEFRNQKNQILQGIDLSRKGSIDIPIQDLVEQINSRDEFVSTSSCSGRVILFCENPSGNNKKFCKWLYTSHEAVDEEEFFRSIQPDKGDMVLKFEPMILHVQCISLESAKLLHTCALESGFRNSGLTVGKHGKIILAVRSCVGLEVPLSQNGELLVPEEYLRFLVRKANSKMEENTKRTEKFYSKFQCLFGVDTV